MKTKLFLTTVFTVAFFTIVSAQQQKGTNAATQKSSPSFVDENNDGVCDNFNNPAKKHYKQNRNNSLNKANKKGAGQGNGQGKRINIIDKNANGVCDNRK